jgi:hypothetical protein
MIKFSIFSSNGNSSGLPKSKIRNFNNRTTFTPTCPTPSNQMALPPLIETMSMNKQKV